MDSKDQADPIDQTDEINLLDYWRVIQKRRKVIFGLFFLSVIAAAVISLLMAPIYQAKATIMPVAGGPETMLARADAALLVGDAALRAAPVAESTVDLVEEWNELTGLPYVHAVWCGRETDLQGADRDALRRVRDSGIQTVHEIAARAVTEPGFPPRSVQDLRDYLDAFSYELTDDVAEGFREFLQYAYFHGVIPDVPDMNFYPAGGEISLN